MKHSSIAASLFFASAKAYTYLTAGSGSGPGPYPNATYFASANRSPNVTKSVDFTLGFDMTWVVNLTEVSVNDSDIYGSNAKILNTVYALQWAVNQDTLNEAVDSVQRLFNKSSLCSTIVESAFPDNTTEAWKESDGSSCSSAIGDECLQAIQAAFMSQTPDEDGCRGGNISPATLPECSNTFDGYLGATQNIISGNASDSTNGSFPLHSGTGFSYQASKVYDGCNATQFEQEDQRLRMMILSSGNGYSALCMRLNATEKVNDDDAISAASLYGMNDFSVAAAAFVALAYVV